MKTAITNILAITGATLVILAFIIIFFGDESNYSLISNFQILGANTVIYFGVFFIHKFECKYVILEYLLDISYIIIVLVIFGLIFNWLTGRLWILAIMAVVIYILSFLIGIIKTREEADEINKLLQKRKDKNSNTAS